MKTRALWCAIAVGGALVLTACGSDDAKKAAPVMASAGASGAPMAMAAAPGAPAAGGALPGGLAGAVGMIPCGPMMCTSVMVPEGAGLPIMIPPACCADPALGICGSMSGSTCMPGPPPAPNCPNVPVAGTMAPGCCLEATQICGVNGSALGMGCVEIQSIPFPGFAEMPRVRCDGTPAPAMGGMAGAPAP